MKEKRIEQREKVKFEFKIREFDWTEKQKEFIRIALDKNTKIIICEGPAGTSKSLLSVYSGLKLLQDKKIGEIFYIRTPVESSSYDLGYLKGDLESKFKPYLMPLEDKLAELVDNNTITLLNKDERIHAMPLGFVRGSQFDVSLVIAEEAANYTIKDFLLLMTRLGKFSKMVFIGDTKQSDIKNSGFKTVYDLFNNEESRVKGIFTFKFDKTDIMRNEALSFIIEKFENIK